MRFPATAHVSGCLREYCRYDVLVKCRRIVVAAGVHAGILKVRELGSCVSPNWRSSVVQSVPLCVCGVQGTMNRGRKPGLCDIPQTSESRLLSLVTCTPSPGHGRQSTANHSHCMPWPEFKCNMNEVPAAVHC